MFVKNYMIPLFDISFKYFMIADLAHSIIFGGLNAYLGQQCSGIDFTDPYELALNTFILVGSIGILVYLYMITKKEMGTGYSQTSTASPSVNQLPAPQPMNEEEVSIHVVPMQQIELKTTITA